MSVRTVSIGVVITAWAALSAPALKGSASALTAGAETVSEEEYLIYNEVVRSKFLTSWTTLVIIERMTTNRMLPEQPGPTTRALFEEQAFFDSRLPHELVMDFLITNTQRVRLESGFAFGVPYRLIAADGMPESDVRAPNTQSAVPLAVLIQDGQTIDRLAFSRVGFASRRNHALVYVAHDRSDGSGVGLLLWLKVRETRWEIFDTELVWTARIDDESSDVR